MHLQDPSTRMLSYVPGSSISPGVIPWILLTERCFAGHLKCVQVQHCTQPATQKGIVVGEWMALVMGMIGPNGCGRVNYYFFLIFILG